ncbi:MAG: hypothetical protein IKP08_08045 [Bacteroidales bacterium]|nr:hypothetical protein [Bacteroidales bacterium]
MKRAKLIGCIVVLSAVVCVNVWNAATTFKGSELNIEAVEVIAEGNVEEISDAEKRGTHWKETYKEAVYSGFQLVQVYQWYKCVRGGDWNKCERDNVWRCIEGSGDRPPEFAQQWMPSQLERPRRKHKMEDSPW